MRNLPVYMVLFLVVAAAFRLDFIFYVIYLCLGIYAWSLWFPGFALRRLVIRREYAHNAFLGEYVPVRLELENEFRLPIPWVQFKESVPLRLRADSNQTQVMTLPGKGRVSYEFRIWAARRGYYRIGPLQVTVGDLFGFREESGRIPGDFLTIYPRIIPLTRLALPSRLPFGTIASRQRLFEDPARPQGVREYRPGDSLRRINWKASAHTNDLLIRTLDPAISLETMILLNLRLEEYERRNRYDGPEWGIVLAASLAAHLIDRRQSVGLASNGTDPLASAAAAALLFDEESGRLLQPDATTIANLASPIPPRRGRAQLMKILETLARTEAVERDAAFAQWLPAPCIHLGWGVTVLIVSPRGDPQVCQAAHRLLRSGFNPLLLVTERQANFGSVRERARRLGFGALEVTDERALKNWQAGQRR